MHIRAAIAAGVLAATVVLGSAASALACDLDNDHQERQGHHDCNIKGFMYQGQLVWRQECDRGDRQQDDRR
ncbi:hypothetical protein [Streptomyces chattanoogensis]|uniref:Lipoprotein n=1 Tax=Streptomyces chattanoogensis TaxID=66876 RepID=A0A0N0GVB8_9ACTN|nr:hypothetical protein [Streptomyces chattanoogensis]KPC59171.1 hypothetical protein ADL29_36170 [Streptomyces chattanoogensis]